MELINKDGFKVMHAQTELDAQLLLDLANLALEKYAQHYNNSTKAKYDMRGTANKYLGNGDFEVTFTLEPKEFNPADMMSNEYVTVTLSMSSTYRLIWPEVSTLKLIKAEGGELASRVREING